MADRDTTVYELKSRVMQLCRDKGWGDNGIQNPQHMAMAMCWGFWMPLSPQPLSRHSCITRDFSS